VFIHAAGERFYVYIQTLYELRRLCWKLFKVKLEIDWGTSDHATAFVHSHLQFNDSPDACDDDAWNQKKPFVEECDDDLSSTCSFGNQVIVPVQPGKQKEVHW